MRNGSSNRLFGGILTSLIGFFAAVPVHAERLPGLGEFLDVYHCTVTDMLRRIHTHPEPDDQDRFLVLNVQDKPDHYVQCAFDWGTVLCEAASGFYAVPGKGPKFTPAQKQALAQLGFSADGSRGNFQRFIEFRSEPDYDSIADLLLKGLYLGYGMQPDTLIWFTAPYAGREGWLHPSVQCIAVS
jgi:hypothetical protein